jgi:hypothetical protein
MLVAIKQFELYGVQVLPGQKVDPRLPPALIVPTELYARRAFVYDGRTVKAGDKITGLDKEKRGILLRTNFAEERESTPAPAKKRQPRKRTRKV